VYKLIPGLLIAVVSSATVHQLKVLIIQLSLLVRLAPIGSLKTLGDQVGVNPDISD